MTTAEQLPLRSYQVRALNWLEGRTSSYLAVDMGLGKTRIVIEHIKKHGGPVLVVAPMRVAVHTWPQEILKWAPELTYTVLHGKDKDENLKLSRVIYIVNYDGLRWLASAISKVGRSRFMKGLLVLDESTMVKAQGSQRFKCLKELRVIFNTIICMSATPSPNGYQDLWSQYFLMDYGATLGSGYTAFFNKYFRVTNSRRVEPLDKGRLKEIYAACSKNTFRLDAEDHLKLPPFVYNDILVQLPPKLRNMYRELEREFVLQLNETTSINAVSAATLSMKLRQFCQGALYTEEGRSYEVVHKLKLEALESIIESLNGAPTLVPIQFKFELAELRKIYPNLPAITGGLSASESTRILNKWNAGEVPVLVCHPASISHGVNLQAGGHHVTWMALTWNYEQYTQLNGRLRRQGQTETVVLNRILIERSVENKIADVLKKKGASQQDLLDALKNLM